MKQRITLAVLFALLSVSGAGLTGCATTGVERSARATNSMQSVEADYRQVATQVDATNASLQDLINPSQQVDKRQAFEKYRANVNNMESLGNRLNKDTADMSAQGQNYFSEWEKEGNTYSNQQIRQLSEERRAQLRDTFAKIPEASVNVKGSLQAYLSDIRDIEKYLSNDLTPQGLEGIRPIAQKAIQNGENLKSSTQPVLATIDRARTEMAQEGMNRGSAAGGQTGSQPGHQTGQQPGKQK